MSNSSEILDFIKKVTGVKEIDYDSDIFNLGVVGDDFHEMIEEYSKIYSIDMTDYLWYFHTDEEGMNFGPLFYRPPYLRVKRIAITPKVLSEITKTKKWEIKYPEHKQVKKRYDLTTNRILLISIFLIILAIWISKLIEN